MKPYTHIDKDGMPWRFEGSRPVSKLADDVMQSVKKDIEKESKKGDLNKKKEHI